MFNNFIGNNHIKKELENILENYSKNLPNILIGGNNSNGKTLLKNLFLKGLKNKNPNINIYNIENINDIYKLIKLRKQKIIVIDDKIKLDLKEQEELNMILKMLYNKDNISFYISLNIIDNIIPELYDIMFVFKLKIISKEELYKYIKEKIKIEITDKKIYEIITISEYNIKKIDKLLYKYNLGINIDILDKDVFMNIYNKDINKYIDNIKNLFNSGIMVYDIMENLSYNLIKNKLNLDIIKIKNIYKTLVEYQIIFYNGNISELQFLAMFIKIYNIINK
jgi:DNA polymerase III delta prime subunit